MPLIDAHYDYANQRPSNMAPAQTLRALRTNDDVDPKLQSMIDDGGGAVVPIGGGPEAARPSPDGYGEIDNWRARADDVEKRTT